MPRHNNPTLTKTYVPETDIYRYRLVKWGTNDGEVAQASAATDALIGVTGIGDSADPSILADVSEGDRLIDVHREGIVFVKYGGNVSQDDLLTSDADGLAVTASSGNRVIGRAQIDGVAGDIGSVRIEPGVAP